MSCLLRFNDYNYAFDPETDLTASSENPNFPVTNLRNFLRSSAWRTANTVTTATVVFDLNTDEEIDSFALIFDPVIGNKLTDGAEIRIQANATNAWTSPAVDELITFDSSEDMYTHFFATPQEYRFWRVYISDPTNPYDYLEIHKIWLGRSLDIERCPNIEFGFKLDNQSKLTKTPYGHVYADTYPDLKTFNLQFKYISKEDLAIFQDSYKLYANAAPIFVCIDATEELFDKDRFSVFGYWVDDLDTSHAFFGRFETLKVKIVEAL